MRIVAGKHRGRRITLPETLNVRPTQDRIRESLFNLLEHGKLASGGSRLAGAIVLDAFTGTGALALEALSRGAASATMMDNASVTLNAARANAADLGETANVQFLRTDATKPPPAPIAHTMIFLDPPYGKEQAPLALVALDAAGWIAAGALIAIETDFREDLELPDGFTLEDKRRYGRASIWLVTKDA